MSVSLAELVVHQISSNPLLKVMEIWIEKTDIDGSGSTCGVTTWGREDAGVA
jgi:hypothetical protein